MASEKRSYDVAIVGGGASGTALLYVLSKYTNIGRIALLEKYPEFGAVNSNAKNNSQTLHVGEIETNYTIEKVRQVYPASMMVRRYTDSLPAGARRRIIKRVQKMVLAVGDKESATLEKRYAALREVFPSLRKIEASGIRKAEPEIMRGRNPKEKVLALFNAEGYAVDFSRLAKSFASEVKKRWRGRAEILLNCEVRAILRGTNGYTLRTNAGTVSARIVVVDADAYSLGFAKALGYGKEFSLIPIAGNFYFTPERLRGKVYRVQDPRMPFAAVHGDPDMTKAAVTRWGPTARFYPALEARNLNTIAPFFASSGLHRIQTWISFARILLDPVRFWYLFRNLLYEIPIVGTCLFLSQVRKIVPTLRASDIRRASGYGGMRLQRVNTKTRELLLGEGKIVGDNIIFNMSPSPGASVCLYNAMRDAEQIGIFSGNYAFDKKRMLADLSISQVRAPSADTSLNESYAS